MSDELITIIVPVYNGENHIGRCLNSIMEQTYSAVEVVVIDDGSTDNTAEILRTYSQENQNIRVFGVSHKGVSYARNAGIAKANGEYIAFVDADDEVVPEYLEVLYGLIKRYDAELAVCHFYHVNHVGACAKSAKKNKTSNVNVFSGKEFLKRMEEPFRYEVTAVCWNKLYKKDLFVSTKYPVGRIYEDSAVMQEILYPIGRLAETSEKLYFYHTETMGITRSVYHLDKMDEVVYAKSRMRFFARKKEWEIYVSARKQYCIAMLKHYYLMKKSGLGTRQLSLRLKKELRKYLKGYQWKRNIPFKVKVIFEAAVIIPYFCGAVIVKWDEFLEKRYRTGSVRQERLCKRN